MTELSLKVKRLRPEARLPVRASDGAAAWDLYALPDAPVTIQPGRYAAVPTGIAIELPRKDLVALLFSRSGHGYKRGVSLVNSVGVIDSDYRGEIIVGLINHGDQDFVVYPGDRIAQLIVTYALQLGLAECDALSDTARGADGFGSTGTGPLE